MSQQQDPFISATPGSPNVEADRRRVVEPVRAPRRWPRVIGARRPSMADQSRSLAFRIGAGTRLESENQDVTFPPRTRRTNHSPMFPVTSTERGPRLTAFSEVKASCQGWAKPRRTPRRRFAMQIAQKPVRHSLHRVVATSILCRSRGRSVVGPGAC
ncbi:hypothetical protein FJ938_00665 [Mesorhizobium sp. B2-4-14]|nr:hypothetical protein FJ938_00665 [Mesorhizobium sp. B2-4-14]